jgi:hypothetical protein
MINKNKSCNPTRFDYSSDLMNIIETFTQVPILVTLQHMLDAFTAIAPAIAILGITLVLTQNK